MAQDSSDSIDDVNDDVDDNDVDEGTQGALPDAPDGHEDDDSDDDEGSSSAAGKASKSDRSSSGNRWKGLGDRIGDRLRDASKAAAKKDGDSTDDDDDAAKPTSDDEGSNREGEDPEKPKGASEKPAKKDTKPAAPPRYAITDKEGDTFVLEMPEGGKISFQADGKKIELENVDDLIAMAQKGAAFDRVSSTAGQERAKHLARISELEEGEKADEELLLKLVFDELSGDELEELREKLDKYRDPEVRKGVEALDREEKRTVAEKAAAERSRVEAVKEFWQNTDESIKTELADFEYLEEADALEIKQAYHAGFDARFKQLAAAYVKVAPEAGATRAEAIAEAEHDAANELLTPEALRAVMDKLNDRYKTRATKVRGKDTSKDKATADKHNRRIENLRDRSKDPSNRSLRSGGASPASRSVPSRNNEPKTFEGKIGKAFDRLRKAAGADDDDE